MKIEDEIKQPVFNDVFQKGLVNILYTAGWLGQRNALILKEYGITNPQFNVLRILRGQHPKPATVNLLIERMLDKTSNASRIVDKLELKKLVTRTVCPSNRRAVDIRITEAGLALLKEQDIVLAREPHLRNLTEAEAIQLNDLLDKIRD